MPDRFGGFPLMDDRFPLQYQVICIVLTALFIWAFSVAREPRQWRRLYQSMFSKSEDFSVNKNKVIDESLKKYGIIIAMIFLVADVGFFVWGATYRDRMRSADLSKEDMFRLQERNKIQGGNSGATNRSSLP